MADPHATLTERLASNQFETRLDVQEDTFAEELDQNDPRAPALAVYGYLSWLQEQLVAALSPD